MGFNSGFKGLSCNNWTNHVFSYCWMFLNCPFIRLLRRVDKLRRSVLTNNFALPEYRGLITLRYKVTTKTAQLPQRLCCSKTVIMYEILTDFCHCKQEHSKFHSWHGSVRLNSAVYRFWHSTGPRIVKRSNGGGFSSVMIIRWTNTYTTCVINSTYINVSHRLFHS